MSFAAFLFLMALSLPRAKYSIQRRQVRVLYRQYFGERFSDQFFLVFAEYAAKGPVDEAQDMDGSFQRGHRQRGTAEDG
jgi:hypothetical protein